VTADFRGRLAALVAGLAHPPVDPATISDDTGLLRGGLDLDSLSLLEIVVGLEGFGIEVPAADVTPEHFGTFARLLAYTGSRRPSDAADARHRPAE
jgi:acyl carrier protein